VELTTPDEGFPVPTEGLVQNQPWLSHPKIDAHSTTDRRPAIGCPKSVRTTDNIAVVQEQMRPILCGAPYCRIT